MPTHGAAATHVYSSSVAGNAVGHLRLQIAAVRYCCASEATTSIVYLPVACAEIQKTETFVRH